MKIAVLDVFFGHGSSGKIVETIHTYLLTQGHQCKAYFGRGPKSTTYGATKISDDVEVLLDVGLSRISGYNGIFSPLATKRLIADLETFQPDLIHLHEVHGYYVNYFELLDYLTVRRIPVVWTLHCEHTYTGHCGYALECIQWKTACIQCPQIKDYPRSLFFDRSREQFIRKRQAIDKMEFVMFAPVSKWLHERVKQSFLKGKPARVVHNGIDTNNVFHPRDSTDLELRHNLSGRYVVLSVAPDLMSERKGGSWVLEVAKRFQNAPITFIMIGVKKEPVNRGANVICIPPLQDQEELAHYYSLADLLLITSKKETFSLVCAESLSCGTPVVGFDSGGPCEVAPNPYGHFVEYGDVDSLVSLIATAQSGTLSIASKNVCIQYAGDSFSNRRMASDYLDMYMEMVEKSKLSK